MTRIRSLLSLLARCIEGKSIPGLVCGNDEYRWGES